MCGVSTVRMHFRRQPSHDTASFTDLEETIKCMYARGDLDRQTFRRLLTLAAQGEIHHDDLPTIAQRLQAAVPGESSRLQDLRQQADHLRDKARQAAEAALWAETSIEVEAQLEIQQGALFRLRDVEAQIANYQTE